MLASLTSFKRQIESFDFIWYLSDSVANELILICFICALPYSCHGSSVPKATLGIQFHSSIRMPPNYHHACSHGKWVDDARYKNNTKLHNISKRKCIATTKAIDSKSELLRKDSTTNQCWVTTSCQFNNSIWHYTTKEQGETVYHAIYHL